MSRQLRPLFDRVVIKELDPDRVRRSGLLVPAGDHEPPPQHGIVLSVGPGVDWWESAGVAMPVKVGDHVVFPAVRGRLDRGRRRAAAGVPGRRAPRRDRGRPRPRVRPHAAVSTGISLEELQLAARNHGMPLEALKHEITPLGLHYLLVHYDIPVVDPAAWRLTIGGLVDRELELSLDDLRAREAVTAPVTMECAGNGRALLAPRPVSQPWLIEAVGTAEWTGVALAPLLAEAGLDGPRGRGRVHGPRPRRRGRRRAAVRAQPDRRGRRNARTCCSPTRATACRCRRSTASRCACWCPAGTG